MEATIEPLVRDFLAWLAKEPRLHAEVIESWRTSCPRLPVWEECTDRKFVARKGAVVEVTARGHAFLAGARP